MYRLPLKSVKDSYYVKENIQDFTDSQVDFAESRVASAVAKLCSLQHI